MAVQLALTPSAILSVETINDNAHIIFSIVVLYATMNYIKFSGEKNIYQTPWAPTKNDQIPWAPALDDRA